MPVIIAYNVFEGQPLTNIPVATITDGTGQASDYAATINWGDGTTSIGTITGPDEHSVFTVTASHTYGEDGEVEEDLVDTFAVTVTINRQNAAPVTVPVSVNVLEELAAASSPINNAFEGQPLQDIPVASFTGGTGQVSNYSATIDWGDGITSAGTITGPDQNGVFTVTASHTYGEDGEVEMDTVDTFGVTVSITCLNATPVTVTDTVNVAEELAAWGDLTTDGYEGQPLDNVPLATFTGGTGRLGDYSATVDWGDGTTSSGTIIGPFQNGLFFVTGGHTYVEDGEIEQDLVDQFTVRVTIGCMNSTWVAITDTVNVGEESPAGGALPNHGFEPQLPYGVQVAPLAGSMSGASNYAVTHDSGEEATSAGRITGSNPGVFTVTSNPTSAKSSRPSGGDDRYWQILHQLPGDQISDANSWVAQDLALALHGTAH